MFKHTIRFALSALAALLLCAAAQAQTPAPLLAAAHTIAGGGANEVDPAERTFTVSASGTYSLTLTDVKYPAPFAVLTLLVTSGASTVATGTVTAGAPQQVPFSATAGTAYVVHVVGALSGTNTYGTAGVQLNGVPSGSGFTDPANPSNPPTPGFNAVLSLPAGTLPPNTRAYLRPTQQPATAGVTYTVDVADLSAQAFPAALSASALTVLQVGMLDPNSQPVCFPSAGAPATPICPAGTMQTVGAAGTTQSATFTAVAGTYTVAVTASAASGTVTGGLFSVHIHGGGTDLYVLTDSLGQVAPVGSATLAPGQAATLAFTDVRFPAALTQGTAAAVIAGSTTVAASTAAGSPAAFTASAGTYQLFALAVPGSSAGAGAPGGVGAYSVAVGPAGGAPAFSSVQVAGSGGSGGTYAYVYGPVTIGATASYNLTLADFNFPQIFTAIEAVAVQNGTPIGAPVTPAAYGPVSLSGGTAYVVVAATPGVGAQGLFGVTLATASAPVTTALATTQGVGGAFGTTSVNIGSGGGYDVTLTDLAFPNPFRQLAAVVTQGATQAGSTYGHGTFHFNATPGTYTINVLATPAPIGTSNQSAGTYGVSVAATPPAPTVTLSASATQVNSGGTVTLTWSSQNATSCTASGGGWSGALATSGSQVSAALTAATTFTLTCSGGGGTSPSQSVTVSVAPQKSGGGGGGGSWDGAFLLLLLGGVAARVLGTGTRNLPRTAARTL